MRGSSMHGATVPTPGPGPFQLRPIGPTPANGTNVTKLDLEAVLRLAWLQWEVAPKDGGCSGRRSWVRPWRTCLAREAVQASGDAASLLRHISPPFRFLLSPLPPPHSLSVLLPDARFSLVAGSSFNPRFLIIIAFALYPAYR